nr:uncharacterized protein LOC111985869 [Quercus suber]
MVSKDVKYVNPNLSGLVSLNPGRIAIECAKVASKIEMMEAPATTKDMMEIEIETWTLPSPLKCSESIENFLNWVDENGEDIEVHSGWIDKQYTQCEDFIIHPELKDLTGYKSLYPSAVKGDWKKVHNICHEQMFLSTVPITNSLDTVFHLAISDDQKDIFEQLLQLLPQESLRIASALRRKNKKGNNLLHIAASVGSVTMCRRIISISKSMINTYNNEGESPLFVAALNGHKDAFLYLHSECGPDEDYCIRNNGDTILHCTIAEEYYAIIVGTDEQELISEAEKKHLRSEDTHRAIFRKCTKKKADIENPVRPDVTQGGAPEMVRKVRTTKVRNEWSILIMNKLLKNTSMYQFSKDIPSFSSHYPVIPDHAKSQKDDESPYIIRTASGKIEKRLLTPSSINRKDTEEPFKSLKPVMPVQGLDSSDQSKEKRIEEEDINLSELTPILVAAWNGITEMVEATLRIYPMAMYDVDNKHQKNIVLLTAEHKQPCVYKLLLSLKEEKIIKKSVFCEVDNEGNSALHLAAKSTNFNWPVPGALSQMQWEIKWYEYIQKSLQRNFHFLDNNNSQTPEEIFTKNHQDLVGKGGSWLNNTSNACSVVAGLFVTSTFSTATNLPDAIKNEAYDKASKIYAGSSFVSFYSSLIAVVMFLAIPTSGCRETDFRHALPRKLLLGLTAFYISIASTLVSFTTGHFFIFRDQLKFVSSTSYIVTYALVTVSSMAVFPLYFHLVWATFKKELQRKYRVNIPHWLLED